MEMTTQTPFKKDLEVDSEALLPLENRLNIKISSSVALKDMYF